MAGFASHLVMRGVPFAAVEKLLGHASIKTTIRYAHLSPKLSEPILNPGRMPGQCERPERVRRDSMQVANLQMR